MQLLWKVSIPSAMPDILAGARVALAICLILAVVTEMQASQPGLGQNILLAQRKNDKRSTTSGKSSGSNPNLKRRGKSSPPRCSA